MSRLAADAKATAVWYFRLFAQQAGIPWTDENNAEIEAMVDNIIAAAKPQAEPAKPATTHPNSLEF